MASVEQHLQELESNEIWLRKLAIDLVGDQEDARDLVQETYAAAIQLSRREPVTRRMLRRIICILAKRKDFNERPLEIPLSVASRKATPEEAEEREEATLALHLAIEELKPSQRRAILLRYQEGRKIEEVARAMGITKRNVYYLLDGARGCMRSSLIEKYGKTSWIPALVPLLLTRPGKESGILSTILMTTAVTTGLMMLLGAVLWVRRGSQPSDGPVSPSPEVLAESSSTHLEDPEDLEGAPRTRSTGESETEPNTGSALEKGGLPSLETGSGQAQVAKNASLQVRLSLDGEPFRGQYYILNRDTASMSARGKTEEGGSFYQQLSPGSYRVKLHSPKQAKGSMAFTLSVSLRPDQHKVVDRDLVTGSLRASSGGDLFAYWTDGAGLELVAWAPSKKGRCHFPCVPVGTVELKKEVIGVDKVSALPTLAQVAVLAGEEATISVLD